MNLAPSNRSAATNRRRRGFTLIEVLASAALATVAIVAAMTALGAIVRGEALGRSQEALQRLTFEKYEELTATTDFSQQTSLSGDFTDRNDNDHTWTASLQAINVTNSSSVVNTAATKGTGTMNYLTLTVVSTASPTQKYSYTGLIFVPGQQTTGAAGAAGAGGASGAAGGTANR